MYLNCKTYFSFRYGTYGTEELVKTAVALGVQRLALTNINATCDTWDFVRACRKEGRGGSSDDRSIPFEMDPGRHPDPPGAVPFLR